MDVRLLIHGSEKPLHMQQFRPIMDVLDAQPDAEYIFFQSTRPLPLHPSSFLRHRFRDFMWDRFGRARNTWRSEDWFWIWKRPGEAPVRLDAPDPSWTFDCPAVKGALPFRPDLVLGTTPHEGHMRYQTIPWAKREDIPVVSIDHGAPMVPYDFGTYRGSMMGCVANACWGQVAADINAGYGAPASGQVVTGSPTIDELVDLMPDREFREATGLSDAEIILVMTTHRDPLKTSLDTLLREVISRWGDSPDHQIVVKPHPMEVLNGTLIDLDDRVKVITGQTHLHALLRSAALIISPASSILIPALALRTPYVSLHQHGCGLADEEEITILKGHLGGADFHPDQIDALVRGEAEVDPDLFAAAFERLGYRADGRNANRILDLCAHIVSGGAPEDWCDPFN